MVKSSQFMDKQTMELSSSQTPDFFNFSNLHQESEDEDGDLSYGFHPIPPLEASQSHPSTLRNCSSMDHFGHVKVTQEKLGMSLISEIDRTMKEHVDKLLHAVDGLSARLSQLESRTCQLENVLYDLKTSAEYNHGRTDGKLRQLENILREVQDGIEFIRDKQEIAETQLQIAKLQGSKGNPQSKDQNSAVRADSVQRASSSASLESLQPLPISGALSLAHPTLPPNTPTLPYQNSAPAGPPVAAQIPIQISQNPIPYIPQAESCFPPTGQNLEITHQQYHVPPQQAQPTPPASYQLYQPAHQLPQVSQSPQLPQVHPPLGAVNPQNHPPMNHYPEETPYTTSDSYPPHILQSSSQMPGWAPNQQFYASSTQQMHGQPFMRPNLSPTGYSQTHGPANLSDMYPYGGSPSPSVRSAMKPSQLSPSHSDLRGGSNYTQVPKAQILPHALPTASSVEGGSGSGESGMKIPVDDIVDKVTAMGFRRDIVRATVRKLTENGESVDLNVVLDKLMNSGNVPPQEGWFGR